MLLWTLIAACTDYGFNEKTDRDGAYGDTGGSGGPTGAGESGGDDSGATELTEADCYDPGTGYDMQPAAALVVTRSDLSFEVAYTGTYADYTSELWVWEPVQLWVGTSHETEIGTSVSLGELETGTELEFAIVVTDTGNTYYSGPADRNADGFKHVAITYVGDCLWVVGFEDQEGGGDQDFNDVQLTISGPLELRPVE